MDAAEIKMGERLGMEFSQDPLFKAIVKLRLEDQLFDEHIESLVEMKDYATTEFEKWYCTDADDSNYLGTPASMRHWLKELNGYVESRSIGRNVAMDYRAVFRLKMILILRKHDYKIGRIAEMVGVRAIAPVVMNKGGEEVGDYPVPSLQTEDQVQLLKNILMSSQFREFVSGIVREQQLMLPGEEVIDELREELLDVKDRFQELTIMSHQIDQRLIRGGECGNLLSEMYESFKQQTSYEEKLASITSMESLIDKFPEEQVLIRLYMDTARNLLEKEVESRERRTAKERASELEERLVELYNVVASDDAVDHEKEQAVISMRSLAEQYPELQSVIRLYVDAAQNKLRELHQVKLEGLEAECRKKLGELLEVISSGSTTLAQKEDQYKEMERLLDVYPSETFTIRLYLDAAMNKITIYRQDEMELKVKEIKARCLELFNLSVAETATGNERDHAFKELQRLHDEHPELSFEIRALVNGAESRIMKKEKKGFFSRIFG